MPNEWFYTINGQPAESPVSQSQLKQLAASGQLQPTDLIWQEGMENWAPASSVKGLFPSSKSEAPVESVPAQVSSKPARRSKRTTQPADGDDDEPGGLVGLHPLLVFLLTLVTLGVFGLVYIFVVASAYSERQQRQTDAAGRPLGKPRHPLAVLVLSYLTLGIYFYYWIYQVMRECRTYLKQTDHDSRIDLSLMLICPPYSLYVSAVRLSDLILATQAAAKVPPSSVVQHAYLFLIPFLFPALPVLAMAQQDALNQLWLQPSGSTS